MFLYHERQESALCGVHCLNNLLQGSYYNASDLADIAHNIDEDEQSLMLEAGQSADFLKFMAEGSGNVADDGFFSVQVLGIALKNAFGLTLIPVQSERGSSAMQNPTKEVGFICNLEQHWLAIRQVNGEWYNLNSLLRRPEHLSQFYLSAYLDTLAKGGYSIFVVRGDFPPVVPQPHQENWVQAPVKGGDSSRVSTEQDDLERAIAASLGNTPNTNQMDESDDELMKAIAESLGTHSVQSEPQASPTNQMDESDDELMKAIAASLGTHSVQSEPRDSSTDNKDRYGDDDDLQAAILLSQNTEQSLRDKNILNELIASQANVNVEKAEIRVVLPSLNEHCVCVIPLDSSLYALQLLVRKNLNLPKDKEYEFLTPPSPEKYTDLSKTIREVNWFPKVKVLMREK